MPDKLALYAAFIIACAIGLTVFWVFWQRRPKQESGTTLQRVAKNTVSPMVAQLINKVIDMGFAILVLRLLGVTKNGEYAFAVAVWWYFMTLSDFGLGTLLTREVAKDKSQANKYVSNTLILRLLLVVASFPLVGAVIMFFGTISTLTADTTLAIILLTISLVPSAISGSLSALFYAYEKMEYPAFLTTATTIMKVAVGVGVLMMGGGIVGLASTAVLTSLFTAIAFYLLVKSMFFKPSWEVDWPFVKSMVSTSFPLLLNNLLASLFFKIDVFLLKPMQGDRVVGWYNASYKFVDGLLIIPSTLTLALFPVLSNYSTTSKEAMLRAYSAAIRVLLIIALPISVGTYFIAPALIGAFAGSEYLPQSAIALQVLIWFLPFSYVNGVTQYVLIAIDKQKWITVSFAVTLVFNVAMNLILIPLYSYVGAAIVTIASEVVLLMPFYYLVHKYVGGISVQQVVIKPVAAVALMGAALWFIQDWNPFVIISVGGVLYLSCIFALRAFSSEEIAHFKSILPIPSRWLGDKGQRPRKQNG